MGRPTTKIALLEAADSQFCKLWKLIGSMSEDERIATFTFEDRDRNVKDVLVHLYEWHMLLQGWLDENLAGGSRPFLPEPYNWKTYPQMNRGFWGKHQSTTYSEAECMVKASHARVMEQIEPLSQEELFEKKHFSWTGSTHVASYCISSTSSHYDWAIKKLKKHLKAYRETGTS